MSGPLRVYVAGPMSGLPEFNYPEFHAAAATLRNLGYEVENPAENDRPVTDPWTSFLRDAITRMLTCDAVVTLAGWEESRGARLEVFIARELGMLVARFDEVLTDAVDVPTGGAS